LHKIDLIHFEDKSDEIVFKHTLVKDALYSSMLIDQKALLHLKIATELERLSHNRLFEVAEQFAAAMICQYRSAVSAADKALEMALLLDDARSKAYARGAVMFAYTVTSLGSWEEIQRHAELGALESDQTDDAYVQLWVRMNAAWSFLYRGLPDRGRTLALELQARGRMLGDPRAASMGLLILG
jgi:hypothetical protein